MACSASLRIRLCGNAWELLTLLLLVVAIKLWMPLQLLFTITSICCLLFSLHLLCVGQLVAWRLTVTKSIFITFIITYILTHTKTRQMLYYSMENVASPDGCLESAALLMCVCEHICQRQCCNKSQYYFCCWPRQSVGYIIYEESQPAISKVNRVAATKLRLKLYL